MTNILDITFILIRAPSASADGDGKDTIPACTGRFLAAIMSAVPYSGINVL